MLRRFAIFHLSRKSLVRGTVITLGSLWASLWLSGYPDIRPSMWLILPLLLTCLATWDHARCLQKRWSFYHGGVLLLIYVDLMVMLTIAFLLVLSFSGLLQQ
ncbi:permease [Acidicapsa dinghuensis]|uniref:Permease n=1 Tax=Acidicapsa dinghuensis TaxID=2218256 RepID=A0ABW1ENJ9_9BACT|nr:permease [Acidicapsa dinghuensis]